MIAKQGCEGGQMAENSGEFDFTEDNPDNYGASSSLHESNALSQGSRSQSRTNFASQSGNNPSNIQMDGRNSNRDPPGQKSVYILPGDPEKETYRLSTYLKFPAVVPVDPCVLARHGFYYTGYKDRVKCFSCGAFTQDWCINDNPKLAQWHLDGCELVLGKDKKNKPISCQPTEFIGTFTSSTLSLDSGYTSSATDLAFGSSAMSNSLSRAGPSRFYRPSSVTLFPSYPIGRSEECRQLRAGADDERRSNDCNTTSQSNSNLTNLANDSESLRLDHRYILSQNGVSRINRFHQPTARFIEANNASFETVKVQGLDLASVTTSKHRMLLTQTLDLHKEADRINSFETWKCHAVSKEALAKSGFFYLGNLDRCQCFSCSGVLRNWSYGDDVHQKHQRHFADCKMVTNREHRNIPLLTTFNGATTPKSSGLVEPPDPSPEEKLRLDREFPCLHPVNPHMRNFDARLQTFDRRWPSHKVLASTERIAKAGFFFLGERDRAKCWYCNGGLQNWDPTDEPFTEHAKWFPGCEYVLRCKGLNFVKNIVAKFPNLRRPSLRNPRFDHKSGQLINNDREQPTQVPIVDPLATRVSAGVVLQNSPDSSCPGSSQSSSSNRETPLVIQQALDLGITDGEIKRALKILRQQGKETLSNVNELLDVVFAMNALPAPQISATSDITSSGSAAHLHHSPVFNKRSQATGCQRKLSALQPSSRPFLSTGFASTSQCPNADLAQHALRRGFIIADVQSAIKKKIKQTGKGFESLDEMIRALRQEQQETAHNEPPPNDEDALPSSSHLFTPPTSVMPSISQLPPEFPPTLSGSDLEQNTTTQRRVGHGQNLSSRSTSTGVDVFYMRNGSERLAEQFLDMMKNSNPNG